MNKYQRRLKEMRLQNRLDHKLTYKGADAALGVLAVVPLYVLHDTFGFGAKRCERFMKEFHRIYRCVSGGDVSIDTLIESLDAEMGLRYDKNTMELVKTR